MLQLIPHFKLFLLSRQILIHKLLRLDGLLLLHDLRVDGVLLLLRVNQLRVGVRLRVNQLSSRDEFLAADGLLELAQALLRVLVHEVGHSVLGQELAQIVQIDFQRSSQILQHVLLLMTTINEVVRPGVADPHFHENIALLSTHQKLQLRIGNAEGTRTRASRSPYFMNSSSLVPLNSSLGSSPSAKHTAQAIVLYRRDFRSGHAVPFPHRFGQG